MEYPIWKLATLGGGFWVALISTLHVYVAHFAVGGGLFLVLTEMAAARSGNPHLLDYAKRHTKFFLVLTMAFGAVSGVAIWLSISLLAPQPTIILIKSFVFGWATEWVCFLGEIVALLVYYYAWEKMDRRDHIIVGWLYAVFGWLSLFLITGIIGFMLTPGEWLQTRSFWDGFFNPTFWPQVVFRTFFAAVCAGLFGYVTATRIPDQHTRLTTVRVCSLWTIAGFVLLALSGWWYIQALPEPQYAMVMAKSQRVATYMQFFWIFGPLVVLGALAMAVKLPRSVSFPLALVVMLFGLGLMGSFESMREAARKPYLIWDVVYSNSILKAQVPVLNQEGVLAHAKWTPPDLREITDDNERQVGEFLYQLECASCHSIDGPMNDILPLTAPYADADSMDAFLSGMGSVSVYMPPFVGKPDERRALARYIAEELHPDRAASDTAISDEPVSPAPFDDGAEFALLAWGREGMHFVADSRYWTLMPSGTAIRAQLVRRDSAPEVITQGVEIGFTVENGPEGVLGGGDEGIFEAELDFLPSVDPYQPLPVVTLEARVAETGEVLATTKFTPATSQLMGCRSCHGGSRAEDGTIADDTAMNILAVHDRINRTNHVERATRGAKILCVECHDDASQNAAGQEDKPNLSAAMHGFHAIYLSGRDSEHSCLKCHPDGSLRGRHGDTFECADCHGNIEDHAIGLLKAEQEKDKPYATARLAMLRPQYVESADEINPRQPWLQQPDCLTCHVDFEAPSEFTAFNVWAADPEELYVNRYGDMAAIACASCHGSPHVIYPATERDNIHPEQYMGEAQAFGSQGTCTVCHVEMMDMPIHHPGMGLE